MYSVTNFRSGVLEMYKLSFLWYSVIGVSITIIVGLIVSGIANAIAGKLNDRMNASIEKELQKLILRFN